MVCNFRALCFSQHGTVGLAVSECLLQSSNHSEEVNKESLLKSQFLVIKNESIILQNNTKIGKMERSEYYISFPCVFKNNGFHQSFA